MLMSNPVQIAADAAEAAWNFAEQETAVAVVFMLLSIPCL